MVSKHDFKRKTATVNLNASNPKTKSNPTENLPTKRLKNFQIRSREHLRPDEVEIVIRAAKSVGRCQSRDALLILMMYRHALRVGELISLQWSDIDFGNAHLYVRRSKGGNDSNQPIEGDELRQLRALRREQEATSQYIFTSERGTRLSDESVRTIIKRAGKLANLDFPIHPHMLRHSCGYYLANKGYDARIIQDYLGLKSLNNVAIYTKLSFKKFVGLWK